MSRAVVFTGIAAIVVFAVVQDRLTVAGVGRYVVMSREAADGRGPSVAIDDVMKPAVADAVQQATLWSALVLAAGAGGTLVARGRRRP